MEKVTIKINTSRGQLEAYIQALADAINDLLESAPDINTAHVLASLLKEISNNLPTQKAE